MDKLPVWWFRRRPIELPYSRRLGRDIFHRLTKLVWTSLVQGGAGEHILLTSTVLAVVLVTNASAFAAGPARAEPTLFVDTAGLGEIDTSHDRTIVRSRFVEVNFSLLGAPKGTSGTRLNPGDRLEL